MKKKIDCTFPGTDANYEIEIQSGLLEDLAPIVSFIRNFGSKIALITNDILSSLYGEQLQRSLLEHHLETHLFVFKDGEKNKSRRTKEILEDQMLEKGLGRDTCLIAMGGGVVLDTAGYVAATYCRGIPLVLIPTSLLAMVDVCIGGKTGVNLPKGKNLIGCIYQPKKVYIDTKTLVTLPLNERRNGMVEMIKHGIIADLSFFEFLERHSDELLAPEPEIVNWAIYQSCSIKKKIVEEDEREEGKRRLLNFGHTIGHALERLHDYQMSHGEAVAIGIVTESYLAYLLEFCELETVERVRKIFLKYALPMRLYRHFTIQSVLEALILDKKSFNGLPRFVIIHGVGSVLDFEDVYCTHIEEKIVITALGWMYHDLCSN